jgi:uncharacterized protein (TIGR01777 family)
MRIIISGGSGLIGSLLVNTLFESGHDVIVLSRNPQRYKEKFPQGVNVKYWDPKNLATFADHLENVDVVVNLAGENIAGKNFSDLLFKRWTSAQKDLILTSRIDTGKALSDAILNTKKKPISFIQASAVGFYGSRGDELTTEDKPPGNDFLANVCVKWENSTAQLENVGVRRAILRTAGLVLNADEGALPFMSLPFRLYIGGHIGNGKQWVSWIHLIDEVNAIKLIIENVHLAGVFNLCSPMPVTSKEFCVELGHALKRPSYLPVPSMVLKLLFGEKADVLLASQRQIPSRLQEARFNFTFPDLKSALGNIYG